ncbi:PREDICTED: uncharacterized protein LOC104708728 [Camelina sativa]|uniref:Uncharacterized protein LOC104708728 n=1 Tax=Camelina sativa TaxID=90675 RepID=A0ABM0TBB8_CAMSA|nr:PREDICTED: uncharacterized protein LOC104708728 [Camelina sativa]
MGPPAEAHQNLKVADLLLPGTCDWNLEQIRHIIPHHEKEILKLRPSANGAPDIWAWLPTPNGIYSAKSGYIEASKLEFEPADSINLLSSSQDNFSWNSDIWATKTSQKNKLLLWKAAQNALPVGENLKYRHITDSDHCPHCGEEETVSHLFLHCQFSRRIWAKVPVKTPFLSDSTLTIKDGIKKAKELVCLPPSGLALGPISPWIFWSLWTTRNQLIFSKKKILEEDTVLIALIRAREWQIAQSIIPQPVKAPKSPTTNRSTPTLTCFTDVSWKENEKAGYGWIIKDQSDATQLQGSASAIDVGSPLMTEALATLTAMRVVSEPGITDITFASDSQVLVQALCQKNLQKELHGTLHDVLALSATFNSCLFTFIPRNQNRQADALAKEALLRLCIEPYSV